MTPPRLLDAVQASRFAAPVHDGRGDNRTGQHLGALIEVRDSSRASGGDGCADARGLAGVAVIAEFLT